MIQVENLSVSFGCEQVIRNLSFTVGEGEKVALSGPSGSGKSTIINLLMGFIPSYTGLVKVKGLTLNEDTVDRIRREVSWMPQELAFKFDSVKEFFFLPFTYRVNRNLRPAEQEVKQLFEALMLDYSILDKQLNEISGGQKQRVALASVLLLKRKILFLDEPTSALDAESRDAIVNYVRQLKGVAVLTSTHDPLWLEAVDKEINLNR